MKKILLIITCILILTGCGAKEENNSNVKLSMEEIKENLTSIEIEETKPFNNEESINDLDLIEGYGIDVTLLEEYVIYISSSVEDPSMYMVLKPIAEKKSVVKYQVEDMFDRYLSAYMGYYPEAATIIEDKMEKEVSDYLVYIVSLDNQKVFNAFFFCGSCVDFGFFNVRHCNCCI